MFLQCSHCLVLLQSYCLPVLLSYSLQSYCTTVLLSYSLTVLQSCSPTALLSYCLGVLLSYSPTVLLSYCLTLLQSYSPLTLQCSCSYTMFRSCCNRTIIPHGPETQNRIFCGILIWRIGEFCTKSPKLILPNTQACAQ